MSYTGHEDRDDCDHLDANDECYPAASYCPDCGTFIEPFPDQIIIAGDGTVDYDVE